MMCKCCEQAPAVDDTICEDCIDKGCKQRWHHVISRRKSPKRGDKNDR